MPTVSDLPGLSDFAPAPRAVTHEWHQRLPAFAISAFARVALVRVTTSRFNLVSRAVTPCTVMPVCLDAPLAPRADRRQTGIATTCGVPGAAPWARMHTFCDRPVTSPAMIMGIERCPKLPLKLTPLNAAPRCFAPAAFPAKPGYRLSALNVSPDPAKCAVHLRCVPVPVRRVQLNGFPEQAGKLWRNSRAQALVARHRPFEWPFRQFAGE